MEHIFGVAAVGFIFLCIYNYRTKKKYTQSTSGYQFLMLTLTWGCFVVLMTYLAIALTTYTVSRLISYDWSVVAGASILQEEVAGVQLWQCIVYVVSAVILAGAWSTAQMQTLIGAITKWAEVNDNESKFDNRASSDWHQFIEHNTLVIFTLKNSKVYVGLVTDADRASISHPDQKTIQLKVVKSGVRQPDGRVKYTTLYPISVDPEQSFENNSRPTKNEHKIGRQDQWHREIDQLTSLNLFQREVVSYTVYDPDLNDHFGHDD